MANDRAPSKKPVQHAETSADPHQPRQPWVHIELKQIKQKEPLAELPDADRGLDDPRQPDSGHGKTESIQEHFQNRHEGVGSHPEQKPLFAVAQPGNEAKDGR